GLAQREPKTSLSCLVAAIAALSPHSVQRNSRAQSGTAHSITSSARARIAGAIVRPSALAVFRLMTNSNLVGCCTGRSAGLAPLRILSTYAALRRRRSDQSVQ